MHAIIVTAQPHPHARTGVRVWLAFGRLIITARIYLSCVRDSVIVDARLPCARTSRRFSSFSFSRAQVQGTGTGQNRTRSTCMRVRILLLLILKSRTLTQRIERDVKKSGIMQQYSGTPGVKSNFRDYPGKSGRVGRSDYVMSRPEVSTVYLT